MPEIPPLPPIASEPISVVLLAHNDEVHLETVVGSWVGLLNGLGRDFEILLVDDASSDRTAELTEPLVARNPRVKLLRHAAPQGEGAALRTGVAATQHPLLVQAPCDRQFRPEDVKKLLAEIDKVHLVSGFRKYQPVPAWLRGLGRAWRALAYWVFAVSPETWPGWLGWREYARRCLARMIYGVRLKDVGCAFRLFRRAIFDRIPIQSDGPFALIEVLAKANFLGHVMSEVPVAYQPRADPDTDGRPRHILAEAYRVFSRPDFGPAMLPEQPVGQA